MKKRKINSIYRTFSFVLIILLIINSCTSIHSLPIDKYLVEIKSQKNLFQRYESDGIIFTMNYIPSDLMAFRESKFDNQNNYDSLRNIYKDVLYFNLSIGLSDTLKSFTKEKELRSKIELNISNLFLNIKDRLKLRVKDKEIAPILSIADNIQNFIKNKRIIIVFPLELGEASILEENKLKFIFEDSTFSVEPIRFEFQSKTIKNLPILKI